MSHHFQTRVYYEDTDAGGIVYHAKYLHFFERARTELLEEFGVSQQDLKNSSNLIFVVKSCNISFLKPAKLCDYLTVKTTVAKLKKASVIFKQEIYKEDVCLASADILITAIDTLTNKIKPFPQDLLIIFNKL